MSTVDYADQLKAINHDRARYAWENESGYWLIGHEVERGPEIAQHMSDAFEYGFSKGWDDAMTSKEEA